MTYLKGITRGLIGIGALCIIACGGGGGTTVTGNPLQGEWTGLASNGDPGSVEADTMDNIAKGEITKDGSFHIRIYFSGSSPETYHDALLGTVSNGGSASGRYLYGTYEGRPDDGTIYEGTFTATVTSTSTNSIRGTYLGVFPTERITGKFELTRK